jgi:hypothetical protein
MNQTESMQDIMFVTNDVDIHGHKQHSRWRRRVRPCKLLAGIFLPVAIVIFCATPGCGYAPRHISLRYEATQSGQASKPTPVTVEKFRYASSTKAELCPYNHPKIFLKEGVDPGVWFATAVVDELKAAGYKVTYQDTEARESVPVLLKGSVHRLACNPTGQFTPTHWTIITVEFTVLKNGTTVFNHTYNHRFGWTAWLGTGYEISGSFEAAARDLLRGVIPALGEAIDQGTDGSNKNTKGPYEPYK